MFSVITFVIDARVIDSDSGFESDSDDDITGAVDTSNDVFAESLDFPIEVSIEHSNEKPCAMINTMGSVFQFTANVTNLFDKNVKSSQISINNLLWNIMLSKSSDGEWVQVDLQSSSNTSMSHWTCLVNASVKLLHKDGIESKTISSDWKNLKYSNEHTSYWDPQYVDWNDFVDNYVNDCNEATFEIELSTGSLNCKKPLDINQIYARLHISLENVSKLREIISYEVMVRGVKWSISIAKNESNLTTSLTANEMDFEMCSSYEVNGIFKLLSFDSDVESSVLNFNHNYLRGLSQVQKTLLNFMDFDHGYSPYVKDDRVNLLVEFKVNKPKSLWANEVNTLNGLQRSEASDAEDDSHSSNASPHTSLKCSICFEKYGSGDIYSTTCGHLFCHECFNKEIEYSERCPVCRDEIYMRDFHPIYFSEN